MELMTWLIIWLPFYKIVCTHENLITRALFDYYWRWIHFLFLFSKLFFVSQILYLFFLPNPFHVWYYFLVYFLLLLFSLYIFQLKIYHNLARVFFFFNFILLYFIIYIWDKSMLEGPTYLVFYENVTVFNFKKMKTSKSCI